jgi:hypothetical protein
MITSPNGSEPARGWQNRNNVAVMTARQAFDTAFWAFPDLADRKSGLHRRPDTFKRKKTRNLASTRMFRD